MEVLNHPANRNAQRRQADRPAYRLGRRARDPIDAFDRSHWPQLTRRGKECGRPWT
jgi:hypothetical protein